jgi:hypothetical protein
MPSLVGQIGEPRASAERKQDNVQAAAIDVRAVSANPTILREVRLEDIECLGGMPLMDHTERCCGVEERPVVGRLKPFLVLVEEGVGSCPSIPITRGTRQLNPPQTKT